jgi:ribonuclease BN (tRNA processing enzyme)
MFEVIALGVGDTFTAKHHTTSLLLHDGGEYLAIDCPDSYRRVLAEASARAGRDLPLPAIERVLITHVHGDHMNGLEGLAFLNWFGFKRRLQLFASAEVRAAIWDERLRAPMGKLWDGHEFREMKCEDYFTFTPLSWTDEVAIGPFSVRARITKHHVPTSALLVRAGARTLGYSADTAFDPALIEWLAQADLIIHETNHGPAHTPYADLAALPAELRAKMRLIHYPDEFDVGNSSIACMREGDVLAV